MCGGEREANVRLSIFDRLPSQLNVFLLLLHIVVAAPACAKHGRESQDRLCRGECGVGRERGRRCRQQVSDLPAPD